MIDRQGPVSIRFTLDVRKPLPRANHGVALYDSDRRLVWGTGVRGLELEIGIHELTDELSELPLKPGVYSGLGTLHDEDQLVDTWEAVPEILGATQPLTHWLDEWAGILNVPSQFRISHLQENRS